jgi:hypothetical protein
MWRCDHAIFFVKWGFRMTQQDMTEPITADPYCPGCGYNLRGIGSDRCPECGVAIDWQAIARSVIPWSYRAKLGRWRGFWRTVGLVSRQPLAIARDVSRPVSFRDAQLFRWLVVLVAWLPLCVMALAVRAVVGDVPGPALGNSPAWGVPQLSIWLDLLACTWTGMFIWPVPSIALLMFLACLSGAPSYFFHPRDLHVVQQNRAVALSYYACAPLTMLMVPCAMVLAMAVMIRLDMLHGVEYRICVLLGIVGFAGIPILFAICLVRALYLLKQATHCTNVRAWFTVVMLQVMGLVLMAMTLLVFPAMCGMVKLMVYSYLT